MAGTELKIDDEYIEDMEKFLKKRAAGLQQGIDSYITILGDIRKQAIKKGSTADALDTFISYAKNLSEVVETLGEKAETTCKDFMSKIDEKDEYLFDNE